MPDTDGTWMALWIDVVADRSASMSQRRLSSVEERRRDGGGLRGEARGVHLAKLRDDEGNVLVAAIMHTFEPLC